MVMTFTKTNSKGEDPKTSVTIHHTGVPHEWVDDLQRLWAWDVAVFARR